MSIPGMKPQALGGMSVDVFLAEYWQKKPLLIRDALKNVQAPLDADSLAGLACEEDIESRLIIQRGEQWQLQHGPFEEAAFSGLPASHWTLLVQAVDHWVPEAAAFLEQFNFIPRWRIDDLMMSYASDGGGVGPHYDNYDVFLAQVSGQRKWEIGGKHNDSSKLVEGLPLKILASFEAEQSWVLNPGDILYLPPGVSHNGVAQGGDCISCSVGFRAPSHAEMLREFSEYLAQRLSESDRYSDTDLVLQDNAGEITPIALAKIQQIFSHYLTDEQAIADWFGRYVTESKYEHAGASGDEISIAALGEHLAAGGRLARNEGSRFAYIGEGSGAAMFVDGERIDISMANQQLVELVCR
ncbi:MAG: cupin domain-containing protein, partial [Pseudomonadales bacterium]